MENAIADRGTARFVTINNHHKTTLCNGKNLSQCDSQHLSRNRENDMARPCLGDAPMTPAERQRRRRARIKAAPPTEQQFRRALVSFVERYWARHPGLDFKIICHSLSGYGLALYMDKKYQDEEATDVSRFLAIDPEDEAFGPTPDEP
jgi:hypothetical protein